MTVIDIAERLKNAGVVVGLEDGALVFSPAGNIDPGLRAALESQKMYLYSQALELRKQLQVLQHGIQKNPREWGIIHNRLAAQYRIHGPMSNQYTHLVSWLYGCKMLAEALNTVALLPDNAPEERRAHWDTELAYAADWVAKSGGRLVSTCLIWSDINNIVMGIKLM